MSHEYAFNAECDECNRDVTDVIEESIGLTRSIILRTV